MSNDLRNLHFTDGRTLPVGTFYCIGRNYAEHAREMGAVVPDSPLVFIKPPSAYRPNGSVIALPSFSQEIHHEAEIVAVVGRDCADFAPDEAADVIAGYAVGLDLTARDVQQRAKQRGEPWATSKSFRGSAPVSQVVPAGQFGPGELHLTFTLFINGAERQRGDSRMMERSFGQLVAYLSTIFDLREGDCVFTGTPAGVAAVAAGDTARLVMHGGVELTVGFQ